jgi:prepilin-type N-terminal cleavage/methylation domain-containing protein
MNRPPYRAKPSQGFTLTELAVVLVITGLVLGGLLVPLSAQMDMRATGETRRALSEIREALLGFAAVNGRFPCPAVATTASGVDGAGREAAHVADNCPNESGVLPWVTLGVSETDAWGQRYSYRVTREFSRKILPPQNAAFDLTTPGKLDVWSAATGAPNRATIASDLPVVIVSHGANGQGGFTRQGTPIPSGQVADELDNQLTNNGTAMANMNFVSRERTASGFDDEVAWIPRPVLISRMITVGKIP